jgi:hypothetical protein
LTKGDIHAKELREERERHVTAIQNAKAEAAASIAEAKQRAEDDMKDLKAGGRLVLRFVPFRSAALRCAALCCAALCCVVLFCAVFSCRCLLF